MPLIQTRIAKKQPLERLHVVPLFLAKMFQGLQHVQRTPQNCPWCTHKLLSRSNEKTQTALSLCLSRSHRKRESSLSRGTSCDDHLGSMVFTLLTHARAASNWLILEIKCAFKASTQTLAVLQHLQCYDTVGVATLSVLEHWTISKHLEVPGSSNMAELVCVHRCV